jgi:Heterokaryon incompatibility protein (HET)
VLIGRIAIESINIRFRTAVQYPSVPLVLGISERHCEIYEKCLRNGIHGLVAVEQWIARSCTLLQGLFCGCFLRSSSQPLLTLLLSSCIYSIFEFQIQRCLVKQDLAHNLPFHRSGFSANPTTLFNFTSNFLQQPLPNMTSSRKENALARSAFPYQPLDEPDGIRLLQIHPASSSQAEIKCSLTHSILEICVDIYDHYTALSYVWGDPNNTKTIWVDDIPVPVTINLYSALRDLRHECKALRLWTDALCINQHDDEGKLKQIAMMGRIYSMADHTVIYLGSLDNQDLLRLESWASTSFDESRFSSEIADLVLRCAWFRRVWVFQEFVFSKDPRVQVGRYRFSWNTLYRVAWQSGSKYMDTITHLDAVSQGSNLLSEMHRARQGHQRKEEIHSEVLGLE